MKSRYLIVFFILSISLQPIFSQKTSTYTWWNPSESEFNVIDGQAWPDEVEMRYDRLPATAKDSVRKPLWDLSHNSAGLLIRFITNSPEVVVRYKVSGSIALAHMPATGVSGVDLYAKTSSGEWQWYRGGRPYGKTITSKFKYLPEKDDYHTKGREYRLYLPLYNSVDSLEVGVVEGSRFEPLPARIEKPIVVYGTSIAQGGCASRPGMAWTAILERYMDRPLINLGFSGNGLLEKEIINLIARIEAKVYILDCLPNLIVGKKYPADDVYNRIRRSVEFLKSKRPEIPILLVDHASVRPNLNEVSHRAFADLRASGIKGLFLLTHDEIGLYYDSFVDGTHPTDYGMATYAKAYEKKLREILNEPVGNLLTQIPVTQNRDANTYNWNNRHQTILKRVKDNPPSLILMGNSITHFWGGEPVAEKRNGVDSWEKYFGDKNALNYGFGWDRVENVLWRVYHDELDGFSAKDIVLMIGTNNISIHNSDEEIVSGIRFLIDAIKTRQPDVNIHLLAIYPGKGREKRVAGINMKLVQLADLEQVDYADIGDVLLKETGEINDSLFIDGLHPNAKGYDLLGAEIVKLLLR